MKIEKLNKQIVLLWVKLFTILKQDLGDRKDDFGIYLNHKYDSFNNDYVWNQGIYIVLTIQVASFDLYFHFYGNNRVKVKQLNQLNQVLEKNFKSQEVITWQEAYNLLLEIKRLYRVFPPVPQS